MVESLIEALPNLGVGVGSLLVLYAVFKMFIKAINERDVAFRNYVEIQGKKNTEVVVDACQSIKESSLFIKEATLALEKNADIYKEAVSLLTELRGYLLAKTIKK